jgi:hypothetical protein
MDSFSQNCIRVVELSEGPDRTIRMRCQFIHKSTPVLHQPSKSSNMVNGSSLFHPGDEFSHHRLSRMYLTTQIIKSCDIHT